MVQGSPTCHDRRDAAVAVDGRSARIRGQPPDFGIRVSGFGMKDEGSGFRDSGTRFRDPGSIFRMSGYVPRVDRRVDSRLSQHQDFEVPDSRGEHLGFGVQGLGFRV